MFLAVQAGKSPLPLCATCSPEAATLVQGEWVCGCVPAELLTETGSGLYLT